MSSNQSVSEDRLNEILEESLRHILTPAPDALPPINRTINSSENVSTISLPISSIFESIIREIPNMLNDISLNNIVYMDEPGNSSENNGVERTDTNQERIDENRRNIENSIIDLIHSDDHETSVDPESNVHTNRPSNTTSFNVNASSNNTSNNTERRLEILDDFIASWFRHTRDYNDQMRLYHQNIEQMGRVSHSIARILQGLVHSPSPSPSLSPETRPVTNGIQMTSMIPQNITDILTRNGLNLNMDIEGFSIPIPRSNSPIIHPTIDQFFEATERYNYTSERMNDMNRTRCPISLEDFQLGDELCEIKHCHHVFKWRSLQNWFSRNSHCPVCRYDIRDYTSSTSS